MKLALAMVIAPLVLPLGTQGSNRVIPPSQNKQLPYTETLRGKQWNLVTLYGKPAVKGRSQVPFIILDRNSNRLNGSGGVNRFVGSYVLKGNSISFEPGMMTKMAGTAEQNKQEMEFIRALESANRYQLKATGLTLMSGAKSLATFRPLVTRL